MNRPEYPRPESLPAHIADLMVAASRRKAVWVNTDGEAFWLNDQRQAEAIAAKHGGVVFAPEA